MAFARALAPLALLTAACAHELPRGTSWVRTLSIEGASAVTPRDIRAVIATQATAWWPLARKQAFDRAALDLDLERIVALYADRGFFAAQVTGHDVRDRGDGSVDVTIHVHEGEPSLIDTVRTDGLPSAADSRTALEQVTHKLGLERGDRFDYARYEQGRIALLARLKEQGFAYARVESTASVDRDRRLAWLAYKLEPGPLVRFGAVHFDGGGSVPRRSLLRQLTFAPGERFSPADIQLSQGRIYELGVFSSVRLQLPPEPTDTADVTVALRPGPRHNVRLGGGLALENQRYEARLDAEWTVNGFLGGLRRLTLRVRPGYAWLPNAFDAQQHGVAARSDLTLRQPDLFGTAITGQALVGYDVGIEPGYQFQGPRAQLDAARAFLSDRLLLRAGWSLSHLNFFHVDPLYETATQLGYGFVNPYRVAYLEQVVQFDLRDRPLRPRVGGYVAARFEEGAAAVGGDFTYFKFVPELRLYAPLGSRVVLAARSEWGWLDPTQDDGPITRRFYLGGPSGHRGFGFGRLSPQALSLAPEHEGERIPIGGNAQVLFSLETRVQVVKLFGYWLSVSPFVDAGDVVARADALDLDNLHWAVGGALAYDSAVGVIRAGAGVRLNRLEYAVGPGGVLRNPDPGDRVAVHFSIGEAF
jgi:translocation and assembly module TamA